MSVPRFRHERGWGSELPDLSIQDVSDIDVDGEGNIHLLYRNPSFVVVATPDGTEVARYGVAILGSRAHGVTPSASGWFVVDEGEHRIRLFDRSGAETGGFGTGPTNPEFVDFVSGDYADFIHSSYPPFTRPTRLAVAESGEIFVSDGYGNCCVHRFDSEGSLIQSWGSPGTGRGEFHIPHDVLIDSHGRVLVCDRENDRVQVFTQGGEFLDEWTDVRRPQGLTELSMGFAVAEGAWRPGHISRRLGPVEPASSRVTVVDADGVPLARFGDAPEGDHPGFVAAHSIAADSAGNLYVAEVSVSVLSKGGPSAMQGRSTVYKYRAVD